MKNEELESNILKHIQRNLEIYQENQDLIELYNQYVKNVAEFFDYLMKKNSNLFYTIVFAILVEIGFFSADREFDPDVENFKELIIRPGVSIVNGNGVCRNVAFFYEDVFKKLYSYPLKLCCLDRQATVNKDTETYGNHVVNLTVYNDTIFCYDIINRCVFKALDAKNLTGLGFDYQLEYTSNGDLLLDVTTCLDSKKDFFSELELKRALLHISSMRDVLSVDIYNKIIHEANSFISQRKKLFRSFLEQNEELTMEIKKKVLSLK